MSRDPRYRRLVGSTRWQRLALATKVAAAWQCQECGRVTRRLAVHHIRPVEDTNDPDEMERRCFDPSNLQVLCYDCHKLKHPDRQGTHELRERQRAQRIHETKQNLGIQDALDF